jgi:hypothetical protein
MVLSWLANLYHPDKDQLRMMRLEKRVHNSLPRRTKLIHPAEAVLERLLMKTKLLARRPLKKNHRLRKSSKRKVNK